MFKNIHFFQKVQFSKIRAQFQAVNSIFPSIIVSNIFLFKGEDGTSTINDIRRLYHGRDSSMENRYISRLFEPGYRLYHFVENPMLNWKMYGLRVYISIYKQAWLLVRSNIWAFKGVLDISQKLTFSFCFKITI